MMYLARSSRQNLALITLGTNLLSTYDFMSETFIRGPSNVMDLQGTVSVLSMHDSILLVATKSACTLYSVPSLEVIASITTETLRESIDLPMDFHLATVVGAHLNERREEARFVLQLQYPNLPKSVWLVLWLYHQGRVLDPIPVEDSTAFFVIMAIDPYPRLTTRFSWDGKHFMLRFEIDGVDRSLLSYDSATGLQLQSYPSFLDYYFADWRGDYVLQWDEAGFNRFGNALELQHVETSARVLSLSHKGLVKLLDADALHDYLAIRDAFPGNNFELDPTTSPLTPPAEDSQ